MSVRERRAEAAARRSLPVKAPGLPLRPAVELVSAEGAAFAISSVIEAEVTIALAEEIITLRLEPASRRTEEEVCGRYGVSRSPVREAFKMLEADDLVVRSARRGVRITPMSRRDLDEVSSCRLTRMLEGIDKQARRHRCLAHTWMHEMLEVPLQNSREVVEAIAAERPDGAATGNADDPPCP